MVYKKEAGSLKARTVSGVKWAGLSQSGRQVLQLITLIILARLLSPSDFGLVGMAMVVTGFIATFKDLGTAAAVIQKRDLSESLLASIFVVNIIFGALAMTAVLAGAPLAGMFYHEPRVVEILRILSINFFISSLSTVHQALLERALAFRVLARLEICSVVSGAIIGISLAYIGAGIWSLVCQTLTTTAVTTALLWRQNRWRPRRNFSFTDVMAVGSFSLNLTGFSIINYFIRNADSLLIGRYLGAEALGFYALAYRILLFPIQNISSVVGRVSFPSFSIIQEDRIRFASAYLSMITAIALISFPIMMGLVAVAQPFIEGVLGEKWRPLEILITILAPVGLVQSIISPVGQIYMSMGRTDLMLRLGVLTGMLIIGSFVIGLHWGINGVALAYAASTFALAYIELAVPFRLIDLKVRRLIKVILAPLANSGLMFVLIALFVHSVQGLLPSLIIVILGGVLGALVYSGMSWITCREVLKNVLGWFFMKGVTAPQKE